jgi:hypothetical protein
VSVLLKENNALHVAFVYVAITKSATSVKFTKQNKLQIIEILDILKEFLLIFLQENVRVKSPAVGKIIVNATERASNVQSNVNATTATMKSLAFTRTHLWIIECKSKRLLEYLLILFNLLFDMFN